MAHLRQRLYQMAAKTNDKKSIEDQAIAKKINEVVNGIDGVSKFVDVGITKSITNAVFGRDNYLPGIVFSHDEDILTISLHINVYFGINIPQLSYDIQTILKPIVAEMTSDKIQAINIIVEGIERNN